MEIAINSAQKCQMDSLRRQLKVGTISSAKCKHCYARLYVLTNVAVPVLTMQSDLTPVERAELHACCPKH